MPYYSDGSYYNDDTIFYDEDSDIPVPEANKPLAKDDGGWIDGFWEKSEEAFDVVLGGAKNYSEWWLRTELNKSMAKITNRTTVVDEVPPKPRQNVLITNTIAKSDDKTLLYVGVGAAILMLVLAIKR